jgi:hypothetical protein
VTCQHSIEETFKNVAHAKDLAALKRRFEEVKMAHPIVISDDEMEMI